MRPEEQGALLGLSNSLDEADHSDRYQIDFDWDYYEKMHPDWESLFRARRTTHLQGLGCLDRLHS